MSISLKNASSNTYTQCGLRGGSVCTVSCSACSGGGGAGVVGAAAATHGSSSAVNKLAEARIGHPGRVQVALLDSLRRVPVSDAPRAALAALCQSRTTFPGTKGAALR